MKHMETLSRLLVPSTVALAIGACGGDGTSGPDANRAPVASFTANPESVPAGDGNQTVVTLDGSASSDPDGDQLTFSWTVPSGQFVENTTSTSNIARVTFPGAAPYTVVLEVDDGNGSTNSTSFTITLSASNQAPTALFTASPEFVAANDMNQTVVTLDGSASTDPDGDALTFSWTAPSGTFVENTSATSQVAKVTFPGTAPYDVRLIVSDGRGGADTTNFLVTLNSAPVASIAANPLSVPAGDANQTVVTLDGTGSSDADGDSLTFSWVVQSGTFVEGTSASSPTAKVTFPGNAPYGVNLTVSDGRGGSDTATLTIALGVSPGGL